MAIFQFTVVKGHQIASGLANDLRFVAGSINAQLPYFKMLGLNIENFHTATLNAEFDCNTIELNDYDYYFKEIKWHAQMPAEDFKFRRCQVIHQEKSYSAVIYQPQLSTKTEHFKAKNVLEIMAPFIEHISYGDQLTLDIPADAITLVFV